MTASQALYGPANPQPTDLSVPSHFEQFVRAHSGAVLGVCLRMLNDRCAAEDACQETFAAAWRHRQELRPNRAWLLRVATNKCLDELRWRSRQRMKTNEDSGESSEAISPEPTPESAVLNANAQLLLQRAVLQLPMAQRVAVVLSDVEGWSYKEISAACDVSMGTVKSRIFRARRSLRVLLENSAFFD